MVIENKKGLYDFEILDTLEAGIVLTGSETKSFFENRVTLQGSFVRIIENEMYLVNAKFTLNSVPQDKQSQTRKLLVHKKELLVWSNKVKEKKLTLIPVSMYTRGRFIKLKIGLARSLKEYAKRDKLKNKDIERETERDYRSKLS